MRPPLNDETRLQLLNEAQPDRPWRSGAERRRCVICDTAFRGDEVIFRQSRLRGVRLQCPACGSGPALWVRLGNPLVDEAAWSDWEDLIEQTGAEGPDDTGSGLAVAS